MIIGKLDRRIRVERFTETVNAYGDREKTWAELITVWAALDMKRTRSLQESIQKTTETTKQRMQWRIRYSPDSSGITAMDRIVYNGKVQDIIGVQEMGRGVDILITSELAE